MTHKETVLVTGGAGFIGANLVHHLVAAGVKVVTLDALTYAGSRDNLAPLDGNPDHVFVEGSIADRVLVERLLDEHRPDAVVNLAAESHVDRSIDGPAAFVETNIVGLFALLEAVRSYLAAIGGGRNGRRRFRFVQVSTDEVYGPIATGAATEESPCMPSSPYAASKAAGDHLTRAWHRTYGVPTIVTRCANTYGPYQFPEKLVPLMILGALEERALPVYGDGRQVRDWLHVADHCRALALVLRCGRPGETYNIGGAAPHSNLEIVTMICAILDRLRPRDRPYAELIEHVEDRPGHDRRYAVDAAKIRRELGWQPEIELERGLEETVRWYIDNAAWCSAARARYDGARLGLVCTDPNGSAVR